MDTLATPSAEKTLGKDRLEIRPVVDHMREKIKLPQNIEKVTAAENTMALATKALIATGALKNDYIRFGTLITTAVKSGESLPNPHNRDLTPPRDSDWGAYAFFLLNSDPWWANNPKERARLIRQSNFDHPITINSLPKDNAEIYETIYGVLTNENTAMPWKKTNGKGEIKRDYQLVESHSDLKMLTLDENGEPDVDINAVEGSVVIIRKQRIDWNEKEAAIQNQLLSKNKLLVYVIDDDGTNKPLMHFIARHQDIDGVPVGHLSSNIASQLGGYRDITDREQRQQFLSRCDTRFNQGKDRENGAVKSTVFDQPYINQLNHSYTEYKRQLPEKLRDKLTMATFLQLTFLEAAGAGERGVGGGVLKFDQREEVQLDHITVAGTISDLKDKMTSKGANRHRETSTILDIYKKESKSPMATNIGGIIGKAAREIEDPVVRHDLAWATLKIGAAVGLARPTMASCIPHGFQLKAEQNGYDQTQINGWGGPALAGHFQETAGTITPTIDKNGMLTDLVIRTKANWEK